MTPLREARIVHLREALAGAFGHLTDPPGPLGAPQAGVAMVFRAGPDPELLLIRRAVSERDPWSGHMALPGGRRDHSDSSLRYTAERETLEETGVVLAEHGSLLGRLEPVIPGGPGRPTLSVFPFVYAVPRHVEARAASREVDAVFWIRESELRDPANRVVHELDYRGAIRRFPSVQVRGQVVWGLTYRIMEALFEQVG